MNRRSFLQAGAASISTLGLTSLASSQEKKAEPAVDRSKPTQFQIACMTLPYSAFPLQRALDGLKKAGYQYVAWGTSHDDGSGKRVPVLAGDASLDAAKELGKKCRALGLEPLMLFGPGPGSIDPMTTRIKQAAAAGIPQVLTMGSTRGNDLDLWVKNLKVLGPVAKDHNVTIVIKQHGGNTDTGEKCAAVTRRVDHPNVQVSYDAGNVLDYKNVDPLPDIKLAADQVASFCIKDHRNWPKDQDCGPGLGEIDHYRLLAPVAFTGRKMPLCCENIFAPIVPRPTKPEEIDELARRAREFLELVTQAVTSGP
ncbi:MAG: sugar phosphate isomerase/epimerase family protein [Gemmataceae bacterium]